MKFLKIDPKDKKLKKKLGWFFIIVGLLALITPFTPGSWLIFVGLELIGIRLVFKDRLKKKDSENLSA